jgi:hypothetical protein
MRPNDSILYLLANMTRTSTLQPAGPSETELLTPPAEPIAFAPEKIPEPAATAAAVPPVIQELDDDRYYAHHWGINE